MDDYEHKLIASYSASLVNHVGFTAKALLCVAKAAANPNADASAIARASSEAISTLTSAVVTLRNVERAAGFSANRIRREAERKEGPA